MFRFLVFLSFLFFILLFFVFTLENLNPVPINFLVQTIEAPLGLAMLVCFIVGALIGLIFSISLVLKNITRSRSLAKKVTLAEREVANLRQLPIKSSH